MVCSHIMILMDKHVEGGPTTMKGTRPHCRQFSHVHLCMADNLPTLNVHSGGALGGLDLSGHAPMAPKQRGVSQQKHQKDGTPTFNTTTNCNGAKGSKDLGTNSNHTHKSDQFGFKANETWVEFCDDLPFAIG
jgi:hypothetical protein